MLQTNTSTTCDKIFSCYAKKKSEINLSNEMTSCNIAMKKKRKKKKEIAFTH